MRKKHSGKGLRKHPPSVKVSLKRKVQITLRLIKKLKSTRNIFLMFYCNVY